MFFCSGQIFKVVSGFLRISNGRFFRSVFFVGRWFLHRSIRLVESFKSVFWSIKNGFELIVLRSDEVCVFFRPLFLLKTDPFSLKIRYIFFFWVHSSCHLRKPRRFHQSNPQNGLVLRKLWPEIFSSKVNGPRFVEGGGGVIKVAGHQGRPKLNDVHKPFICHSLPAISGLCANAQQHN